MTIIRTVLTYLYIIFSVISSNPWLKSVQKELEEGKLSEQQAHEKVHQYYVKFARRCLALANVKVETSGMENIPQDEAVLFAANHQSYSDVFALMGMIEKPIGFVAKDDLGKIPFFTQWVISSSSVLIARGETRKALEAIIQTAKILKSGHSIVIFPEGTRSADGKLLEFKPGSLKAAQKGKVAIVPIAIDGAIDAMNRKQYLIRPATIRLTVLPKIDAEEVQTTDTTVLAGKIRHDIAVVLGQEA